MHAAASSPTEIVPAVFTPPVASTYVAHVNSPDTANVDGTLADDYNSVRVDAWEEGLCGCLGSCFNCCMAACLPCVTLAQIAQRIGWDKYWRVLLMLLGLYLAEFVISEFVLAAPYHRYWFDYRAFDDDDDGSWSSWPWSLLDTSDVFGVWVSIVISAVCSAAISVSSFFGSVAGLVLIFVTWALRARVRSLFNIPGSCYGDCFASFCCSCCAVAQMAAHVQSYTKGHCNFGPVDTLPAFLPQ